MNFVEELKWRGMIHQMMPGTEELLEKEVLGIIDGCYKSYLDRDFNTRLTQILPQIESK